MRQLGGARFLKKRGGCCKAMRSKTKGGGGGGLQLGQKAQGERAREAPQNWRAQGALSTQGRRRGWFGGRRARLHSRASRGKDEG
jgi:hypothetical protein